MNTTHAITLKLKQERDKVLTERPDFWREELASINIDLEAVKKRSLSNV